MCILYLNNILKIITVEKKTGCDKKTPKDN